MRHTLALILTVALLALTSLAPAHAAPGPPGPPPVIDADGHFVEGAFRDFVLANGGLERFGRPLSDAFLDAELGAQVQYFEYARLERHGDRVLLTRLGTLRAHGREGEPPFQWVAPDAPLAPGRTYVPESGHTLGGAFGWYHDANGGAALLGLPISEEFVEPQPDGTTLLVQYFERARLSYHPELAGGPGEVQRAPLGAWMAGLYLAPAQLAPRRPLAPLASATIGYTPGTAFGANIELAAARLDGAIVEPGRTLSFLGKIGEISQASGYRPAPAIVGGVVVESVGGGVCAVSTVLYRAAWSAGLPIAERRNHSLWLSAFADQPGLDAAVSAPELDLRIANDTGERVYVVAAASRGQATVTLWGRGDGRTTAVGAPRVSGEETIVVSNARVVRASGGAVLRNERVVSRYALPPPPDESGEQEQDAGTGAW
jgi:hypothetical protein